jgi:hypothetical protein
VTTVLPPTLRERVAALLRDAATVYAGTPWEARFEAAVRDAEGPLRVALAGRVKTGKSTLLNALVGEPVAATDAGECTRIVTEYAYGPTRSATTVNEPADRSASGPGSAAPSAARTIVTLPNERLRRLTVIDTPGLASLSRELGAGAERFLVEGDGRAAAPDAVLYLLRRMETTDSGFLQAFRDPAARSVPPVNAVGVLARADEIGGGRTDALDLAAGIALDYARDVRLRPFVQTVVPMAGLLAEASAQLSEQEFSDLTGLAGLATGVTDALGLSVDRFVAPRRFVPVDPDGRRRLLARLGLFGVRWSLSTLRSGGVDGVEDLRSELGRASGLDALRRVLDGQIVGRREVLKADAAIRLVQRAAVTAERPGSRRLRSLAERLTVGAHDFAELRLLGDVRVGSVAVDDVLRERVERLLGASGTDPRTRLGLAPGSGPDEVTAAVTDEHARWRAMAGDPLTEPDTRRVADVLVRTLEGIRRDLSAPVADRAGTR